MSRLKILGITVLLSLASLLAYLVISFKYPTIVAFHEMNFLSLKEDIIVAELVASIQNKNRFGAILEKMNANIYIDNQYFGKGTSILSTKIKANDITKVTFKSNIDLKSFSKQFESLMRKNNAKIRVEGVYTLASPWRSVNIKANTEQRMAIKTQFRKIINASLAKNGLNIKSIRPNSISMNNSELKVEVEMTNSFPFDYTLRAIKLNLFMGEEKEEFGYWTLLEDNKVMAQSKISLSGKASINNRSAVGQFIGILTGRKEEVVAKGYATVLISGNQFKFPITQKVPLSKAFF